MLLLALYKILLMSIGWIIFILATLGWHIGMYGMFKKAGIEGWKAFILFIIPGA